MTEFDYDAYTGGDYVRFNEPGDGVIGTIKAVREGRDFNGNACPELVLEVDDNGAEQTVTAGQVMLRAALAEKRPQVGQRIRIVYTRNGPVGAGGNPAKEFTVDVKDGQPLVSPAVANSEEPF